MNNITDNEKIEKTVQKPCSNTSKSGANADKSRGSGKSMNMSPMNGEYIFVNFVELLTNTGIAAFL